MDENAIYDANLAKLALLYFKFTGQRLPSTMSREELDASAARRKAKK